MVQLSTTYDSSLKQKIFVLKGEESYARSTDIILNLVEFSNSYNNIQYMRVGLELDVLRDIGTSSITLYNGEDVLAVYDWDDESTKLILGTEEDVTSGFNFPYQTDIDLWARYNGTKFCMKSESEHIRFNKDIPDKYSTTLTDRLSGHTLENGIIALPVRLECKDSIDFSRPYSLQLYIDDEPYQTVTGTLSANRTVYNLNNQFDLNNVNNGLHTFKLVYLGDDYTSESEVSFDISMGYNVSITCDKPLIPAQQWVGDPWNRATVTATDYFNTPVNNGDIILTVHDTSTITHSITGTTGSDGKCVFNLNDDFTVREMISYNDKLFLDASLETTHDTYSTGTINIPTFVSGTIRMDTTKSVVTRGQETTIMANVLPITQGLPVYWGTNYGTSYTNSKGLSTINYTGTGAGNVTFTANVGEVNNTITIIDALYYWKSRNNLTPARYANCTVDHYSNSVKIFVNQVSRPTMIYFDVDKLTSFELSFDIVYSTDWKVEFKVGLANIGSPIGLNSGDKLKLVYNGSTLMYYINGVLKKQKSVTFTYTNKITVMFDYGSTNTINIDNLILART